MTLPISYPNLMQAIREWCDRSVNDVTFNNMLPVFVSLAEKQLHLELLSLETQNIKTGNVIANNFQIPKPNSWFRTISLFFKDPVTQKDYFFEKATFEVVKSIQALDAIPIAKSDLRYYADLNQDDGNNIYISYNPDRNYTYTLIYFSIPNLLTVNTKTNTYTDYYWDILFYLTLAKAYVYLGNGDKMNVHEAKAKELMSAAMLQDQARLTDRYSDITLHGGQQDNKGGAQNVSGG